MLLPFLVTVLTIGASFSIGTRIKTFTMARCAAVSFGASFSIGTRIKTQMSLVLSDKEIAKDEIGLIYGFGNDIDFTDKEISVKFASMIQRNYVPSFC